MSVGLLRVLAQNRILSAEQVERYQKALGAGKDIIPMLFNDNVTDPKSLAELLAGIFNYPVLDLTYYPRSNIVQDILPEEQMQKNNCIPIFKRGGKLYLAVSDPTRIQEFQKLITGYSADLIVVRHDQLLTLTEWLAQRSTTILRECRRNSWIPLRRRLCSSTIRKRKTGRLRGLSKKPWPTL